MAIKAVATPQAREAALRVCAAQADARAVALAPIIAELRARGITAPYAIAAALTERGIPTARGHRFWMAGPVRNLLNRLDRLSATGALDSEQEKRPARSTTLARRDTEASPEPLRVSSGAGGVGKSRQSKEKPHGSGAEFGDENPQERKDCA
jgi:hypothetical protein